MRCHHRACAGGLDDKPHRHKEIDGSKLPSAGDAQIAPVVRSFYPPSFYSGFPLNFLLSLNIHWSSAWALSGIDPIPGHCFRYDHCSATNKRPAAARPSVRCRFGTSFAFKMFISDSLDNPIQEFPMANEAEQPQQQQKDNPSGQQQPGQKRPDQDIRCPLYTCYADPETLSPITP
jgi:hypothetical protein